MRTILHDSEFRNAWNTFRGGWKWKYSEEAHAYVKVYRKRGGLQSTFTEKMEAAKVIGWHRDEHEAIGKLRNLSP